ncbi:MAG: hypothetical protein QN144_10225 [Armatimonadota bacterium]|nr:hypothetical protein [Armatimonadota bacterium]
MTLREAIERYARLLPDEGYYALEAGELLRRAEAVEDALSSLLDSEELSPRISKGLERWFW